MLWKKITDDASKLNNRLEIYQNILSLINQELMKRHSKSISVRYVSGMSYDEISKYLEILEEKGFLQKIPLSLTSKGRLFLKNYNNIVAFLKRWNIYEELEC